MSRRGGSGHEPALGDLSDLEPASTRAFRVEPDERPRVHARPARETGRRRLWPLLLLLLLALIGAAWAFQDQLRGLIPDTTENATLARADAALAARRLSGDRESALSLYQSVLAEDADNPRALAGVRSVGDTLLADATAKVAGGDLAGARIALDQATAILLGGDAIDLVTQALDAAEKKRVELDPLLERALAAQRAGRLTGGAASAAVLYRRALTLDPTSGIAKRGLADIEAALSARVESALDRRDRAAGTAAIDELARLNPASASLPGLRARLQALPVASTAASAAADADTTVATVRPPERPAANDPVTTLEPEPPANRALAELLDTAELLLRDGRIDAPNQPNARALIERALALDRDNPRALALAARIARFHLLAARAALEAGDLDAAVARFADAERAGASADELDGLAFDIREAEESGIPSRRPLDDGAGRVTDGRPAPGGDTDPRVDDLIARGERALGRGDLLAPPGDSAHDLFRQALALDPDNARARAGFDAIGPRARALFDAAIGAGDLVAAEGFLEAAFDGSSNPRARDGFARDLANAWLDVADRALIDGAPGPAARAIDAARRIDRAHPALPLFEQRLAALSARVF